MRRHPLRELSNSLRVAAPPQPAPAAVLVEVRVWFPGREAVRIRGHLDTLDMNSDYVDVTSWHDTWARYVVGERKFTVTGRVKSWKKKDRS